MNARTIAKRYDNRPEMLVQVLVTLVREQGWVSEDAVLYFEGGSPDTEIDDFIAKHSVHRV